MNKRILLLIIYISSIMLASCQDSKEVDSLLHVNIIGVERGIPTNEADYKISYLKGKLRASFRRRRRKCAERNTTLTVDAPSFFTGIDMLNAFSARRLNFMHTEVLVISEDLAESGLLGEFLAPIIRFRQIRRSMYVVVINGSPMDFIDTVEPVVGTALIKYMQILIDESKFTGFSLNSTLNRFYDQIKSSYRQPTVILGALSNPENLKQEGEKREKKFKTGGEYYAGELPTNSSKTIELSVRQYLTGIRWSVN